MSNFRRYTRIFFLAIAAIATSAAFFPHRLCAREPVPVVIRDIDGAVFSDPGEDPHLKANPGLRPIKETETLGTGGCAAAGDGDARVARDMRVREGKGCGFGSRMNLAWRIALRAWLDRLQ